MNKIQNFLNSYSNLNKTSNSISKKIDNILMRPGTTEQQRSCLLMVDVIMKSIIISRHLLKNTILLAENYYNLLLRLGDRRFFSIVKLTKCHVNKSTS